MYKWVTRTSKDFVTKCQFVKTEMFCQNLFVWMDCCIHTGRILLENYHFLPPFRAGCFGTPEFAALLCALPWHVGCLETWRISALEQLCCVDWIRDRTGQDYQASYYRIKSLEAVYLAVSQLPAPAVQSVQRREF